MANLYRIQTKQQSLLPFRLNAIQRRIHEETAGHHRILHLKARQLGVSTYWLLRELDEVMWKPHTTCAILAHDQDTIQVLFEIIHRAYESIPDVIELGMGPPWRKPQTDRKTIRMLKFPELDSKIYVDLEIRGGTCHSLHISEAAYIYNMEEVWAATQETVPVSGRIVIESTANGAGNWFYEQWKHGEGWKKMFFPWHELEENIVDFSMKSPYYAFSPEYVMRTLDDEERKMMMEFDLDEKQLAWYRYKLSSYTEGQRYKMKQEHPNTADEAFIYATGRFFPEFSRALHVIPDLPEGKAPPHVNTFATLDYGWTNPSCIGLWYVDFDGNCICFAELYGSHIPVKDQCEWLKAQGFTKIRFCDPSIFHLTQQKGTKIETIADEYRRNGINLSPANNDRGAGCERIRDYLRVREGHKNPVMQTVPAPTMYFCKCCAEHIREFESVLHAKNPGKRAIHTEAREDYERTELVSHAIDSARYLLVSRPPLPRREVFIPPNTPLARMAQFELQEKLSKGYL